MWRSLAISQISTLTHPENSNFQLLDDNFHSFPLILISLLQCQNREILNDRSRVEGKFSQAICIITSEWIYRRL